MDRPRKKTSEHIWQPDKELVTSSRSSSLHNYFHKKDEQTKSKKISKVKKFKTFDFSQSNLKNRGVAQWVKAFQWN